jgi:hypothetical protein
MNKPGDGTCGYMDEHGNFFPENAPHRPIYSAALASDRLVTPAPRFVAPEDGLDPATGLPD